MDGYGVTRLIVGVAYLEPVTGTTSRLTSEVISSYKSDEPPYFSERFQIAP